MALLSPRSYVLGNVQAADSRKASWCYAVVLVPCAAGPWVLRVSREAAGRVGRQDTKGMGTKGTWAVVATALPPTTDAHSGAPKS